MKKLLAISYASLREIAAALGVTLFTTWALLVLRSDENTAIITQLYLLPVGISAALWGWRGGISAALASFLAFNYFFLKPYYTLAVHRSQDVITLVVFLAVAGVISQLISRARRSQALAEARQRDAIRLYELNNALASLNDPDEILHALAEQTLEVFHALCTEIYLEKRGEHAPKQTRVQRLQPGQILPPAPSLLIPLESGPGLTGEARLWLEPARQKNVDQRAIQAFVVRGVVALERAQMAVSERHAQALAESDRLKSALLSSVSHELRTPLATIKAAVTSLSGEHGLDPDAQMELLNAIEEETDHLNQLVGNLLSMSRLEAGVLQPNRHWNSIREILDGVLARQRLKLHQLVIDVSYDLPLVPVDYVLMEQVFANLLSNCTKYAPEDSLISVHAQVTDDQALLVQVTNQGPPVSTEHLEHIFDKFYRVTAAEKISGIGLGLSICKGIVEAHGGRIWAENLSQGFTFLVSLPLVWQGEQPYLPTP